MYYKIASNMAANVAGTAYSQAIDMSGANAVNVAVIAMQGSGLFAIQEGNDLENWNPVTSNMSGGAFNVAGGTPFNVLKSTAPNITGKYVRVQFSFGNSGVLSADVNTTSL